MLKKIVSKFIIILLLFLIFLIILSMFNISFLGFRIFKVVSGSMKPYLNINDIVIVYKNNNYQINDVITYKKNNEYITHRIIDINDKTIITKGDNNNSIDELILKKDIIGKVIYKNSILKYLFKPLLIIFILIIIWRYYHDKT